ncbi:cellobiose phosphorylase [Oceanobacillus sp. FSL K6-3682]|uniref:GH36-type glycosyl hydrolase domain-containing protein n=1 Tax=Oceanobacillus sp. FSL K6-3682 TaxID=2921503 RepID=UPI0030D98C05
MTWKDTLITLKANDLHFTFHQSGDIYEITHGNTLINQWMSNPIDGALNNIYLRIHNPDDIQYYPLLGTHSSSEVFVHESQMKWTGEIKGVQYQVIFTLNEKGIWFWDVKLEGQNQEVDIIYGQDLGLGDKGGVRSNEAYMSQYIDHNVFQDEEKGFIICSRQNQTQSSGNPYIQQGSLNKTIGYATDGFQFFGLDYKASNKIKALQEASLPNEIYQYEFAYTALQSEKIILNGKSQIVFYGLFKANHPEAINKLEFNEDIYHAWKQLKNNEIKSTQSIEKVTLSEKLDSTLETFHFTEQELDELYPKRILEETNEKGLLSFFTEQYEHIVLKEKEKLVERPHGHIVMSGQNHQIKDDTIASTSYMYGIFNAQVAIGNTNMNKMMTNVRNSLNIIKTSGQRIYIEINEKYHLLALPSIYELGFNYARWYYKTKDDVIIVTNYTVVDSPIINTSVISKQGKPYKFLVTNQITMQNNEYEVPFHYHVTDNSTVRFTADEKSDSAKTYPNLAYQIEVMGADFEVSDEQKLAHNISSGSASLVVLDISSTNTFEMRIQGSLNGEIGTSSDRCFEEEVRHYRQYYNKLLRGFNLSLSGENKLDNFNAIAHWYTHNMLVHFSVPHGLEQYSGAAWGTRDVCQGPSEYFLATQHFQTVRQIIRTVYSHQYEDTGNWPQWFMFDKYESIQQEDSHGDIIVWPLKLIADYINISGDYQILEEKVPYTSRKTFEFTKNTATILEHIQKEISYIKDHFLHDTHLSAYGGGDWDDTLQPASNQLKKYMSSSWTVALTYQTFKAFSEILGKVHPKEAESIQQLACGIRRDFNKYILKDDVIPGFVYMENSDHVEYMLHPADKKTGIHYRLLPMQESIIAELFDLEQAQHHYEIIKEHLQFPDGVRLMDRPATYTGGVSTNFQRAEQASNFGREIGLQYVHAHIRFIEAMAKLGNADEVWNSLAVINPIQIKNVVPNAEIRQSNTYFSSSDGKFKTRYEAQENFTALKNGLVPVKGGWRIYSSGPGIYLNQLISNALGIRQNNQDLIIDPVISSDMDGLHFDFMIMDKEVTFIYHLNQQEKHVSINGNIVDSAGVVNPYRSSGFIVKRNVLEEWLTEKNNIIDIYL